MKLKYKMVLAGIAFLVLGFAVMAMPKLCGFSGGLYWLYFGMMLSTIGELGIVGGLWIVFNDIRKYISAK